MAASSTKRRTNWSPTPKGPIAGSAMGFLGIAALSVIGQKVPFEPLIPAVATGVCCVGSILHSADIGAHTPTLLYRLLCVLGAGSWLTYTISMAEGLPKTSVTWLGLGVLTAAVTSPLFRHKGTTARAGRGPKGAVLHRKTAALAAEWEQRVWAIARIQMQVLSIRWWDSKAGYSITGFMYGGATRSQLSQFQDSLASDAGLPDGCGVEVDKREREGRRNEVILHVSTVNKLTEDVEWDHKLEMTSFHEPKKLGSFRDGSPVLIRMRSTSGLVIGQRDSGKTTVLQGMTYRAIMCYDALGYHLDLNGGSLSQPWLQPWLEGVTDRPAIDWAASNLDEGLALVSWLLDVAKDRKHTYRHLKIKHSTSRMPIGTGAAGEGPPALTLFLDEGAEVLAPGIRDPDLRELREMIEELQRVGRDAAVNVIASALRATQDTIAPNIKLQSTFRAGMFVMDESELNYLFGWKAAISTDDLYGAGTGFVQSKEFGTRAWKAGNLFPEGLEPHDPRFNMVGKAAIYVANHRPDVDAPAAAIGGRNYAERLERMRAAFTRSSEVALRDDEQPRAEGTAASPVAPPERPSVTLTAAAAAPGGRPHLTVVPDNPDQWPSPADIAAQAAGTRMFITDPRQSPETTWTAEQVPSLAAVTGGGQGLPPVLVRCLEAFAQARDDRMHSATLAAVLGISQEVLAELLRPLGIRTLPNAFSRSGVKLRGYALEDFETATERIRSGQLQVPEEVAGWGAA
ncbi:hypothetical protein [Nonomuraea recticatena]|uniref:Uncharacterized protein n=1 Tax=Nonomuraea recticatena TaxID=46178 RepID=A0ABN3RSS2_9ACTN